MLQKIPVNPLVIFCFLHFAALQRAWKTRSLYASECFIVAKHGHGWVAPHLPSDLNSLVQEPCFFQFCTLCSYATACVFTLLPIHWAGWNWIAGWTAAQSDWCHFADMETPHSFPFWCGYHFHISQGGISTGHVGQEAVFTVLLWNHFSFSYCLLTESLCLVLVWMPPLSGYAASSSKSVVLCVMLQVPRNLANNLIASHLHWAHSEKCFVVSCGVHRWQHTIYLQASCSQNGVPSQTGVCWGL